MRRRGICEANGAERGEEYEVGSDQESGGARGDGVRGDEVKGDVTRSVVTSERGGDDERRRARERDAMSRD